MGLCHEPGFDRIRCDALSVRVLIPRICPIGSVSLLLLSGLRGQEVMPMCSFQRWQPVFKYQIFPRGGGEYQVFRSSCYVVDFCCECEMVLIWWFCSVWLIAPRYMVEGCVVDVAVISLGGEGGHLRLLLWPAGDTGMECTNRKVWKIMKPAKAL